MRTNLIFLGICGCTLPALLYSGMASYMVEHPEDFVRKIIGWGAGRCNIIVNGCLHHVHKHRVFPMAVSHVHR